jgi:hypothetical protein
MVYRFAIIGFVFIMVICYSAVKKCWPFLAATGNGCVIPLPNMLSALVGSHFLHLLWTLLDAARIAIIGIWPNGISMLGVATCALVAVFATATASIGMVYAKGFFSADVDGPNPFRPARTR